LLVYLVIVAGTIGGMLGDNLFYLFGRRLGPRAADRLLKSDRAQKRYRWAQQQIRVRGPTIIIVGRFIPKGRTVTTFACGTSKLQYRRFLLADSVAALAWATYTAPLGFFGGSAFRDALWQPLIIGLGVALVLGTSAELLGRGRGGTGNTAR
jgi:membrane-associated protein